MKIATASLEKNQEKEELIFKISLGEETEYCEAIDTNRVKVEDFMIEVGKENGKWFQILSMGFPEGTDYKIVKNGKGQRKLVFFKSNGKDHKEKSKKPSSYF